MGEFATSIFLPTVGKVIIKKAAESFLENREDFIIYFKSKFTKIKNQDVRFSISYLIRIQVPGSSKFLLVRGNRIKEQFQPVGGVYQKYNGFSAFDDWGYKPDCGTKGIENDAISKDDLRFTVKGRYTLDVIKWFETKKGREDNAHREFNEELIETEILDREIFKNPKFDFIRKVANVFKFSTYHGCYEVLIYDIVNLLPTPEQTEVLRKLLDQPRNPETGYILADRSEIEQLRLLDGDTQIGKIGEHTKYLINEK